MEALEIRDRAWAEVQERLVTRWATVDLYKTGRCADEWRSVTALAVEYYEEHRHLLCGDCEGEDHHEFALGFAESWIPQDPDDRARFFDHLGLSRNPAVRALVAHGDIVAAATEDDLDGVIAEFLFRAAMAVMYQVFRVSGEA